MRAFESASSDLAMLDALTPNNTATEVNSLLGFKY